MKIKKSGFTLIELLTVIAVVGLLSSIVIVAIKDSREKAKLAAVKQFSANIKHALGAYIVGEWNFDDNTFNDSSGNGNITLTSIGDYGWTIDSDGIEKTCAKFGISSLFHPLEIEDSTKLDSKSGSITLEIWIKPDSNYIGDLFFRANGLRFDYKVFPSYNWTFLVPTGGGSCSYNGSPSNGNMKIGEWNHIVGVYDKKGESKIYLNANLIATNLCGGGLINNTIPVPAQFLINMPYDGTGHIDQARIYDSPLTLSQVRENYAKGLMKLEMAEYKKQIGRK